eukprot:291563_1
MQRLSTLLPKMSENGLLSWLKSDISKIQMFDSDLKGAFQIIRNTPVNIVINENKFNWFCNNYTTDSNEIFLVSYPKSGQHFLKKTLIEIMRHSENIRDHNLYKEPNIAMKVCPWFDAMIDNEESFNDFIKSSADCPRLWHNHSSYNTFPVKKLHPMSKIIYISRNPKDCIVSDANFISSMPWYEWKGKTVSDYYPFWINGCCWYGDYFDHNLSWYNAALGLNENDRYHTICKPHQIHFMYYEDLKINPISEITKIIAFLNSGESVFEYKVTNGDIENISDKICFDNMVNELNVNPSYWYDAGISIKDFFRKGKINDYENELTRQQIEEIDRKTFIKFAKTNIK